MFWEETIEGILDCTFAIDWDKKLFELPNVWLLFKDEVVDCGGSRGNVVELLDKGGSVLIGGVDEKGTLENGILENESEVADCWAKVIPTSIHRINKANITSERKIIFFIKNLRRLIYLINCYNK